MATRNADDTLRCHRCCCLYVCHGDANQTRVMRHSAECVCREIKIESATNINNNVQLLINAQREESKNYKNDQTNQKQKTAKDISNEPKKRQKT